MHLPDLSHYRLYRIVEDIDLDGVVVPGLRGSFYRRARGARVHTVGFYEYAGSPLLMAWGYVGEEHCRFTALRRPDGSWGPARPGCPPVRMLRDGDRVTALALGPHVLPTVHPSASDRGGRGKAAVPPARPGRSRQRGSGACAVAGEVANQRT